MDKRLALVSVILLATISACGGGSSGQASPNIAGLWTITCTQPAPDCANLSVVVDQTGALLHTEVPGFSGTIQGGASVYNPLPGEQTLEINILDPYPTGAYKFVGNLAPDGGSAQGTLTIADIENGQETVPASAVLTHP